MDTYAKRTTIRHYDADLEVATDRFHQATGFQFAGDDEFLKSLADTLNNEWTRGITIDAWVERVLGEFSMNGRRPAR